MGSMKVFLPTKKQLQNSLVALLRDVSTLEKMLERDLFETDPIRIGAEQEMCLVDKNWRPSMKNIEVLETANNYDLFTTELARFNLEANVEPLVFKGGCLSKMEQNILDSVNILRASAKQHDADILLTGILPTVRKLDLSVERGLTPYPRYQALCDGITAMRGTSHVELNIRGVDELMTRHDSPLVEGCNTGFQVHLQVTPDDFTQKYNIAQAIAGPALAIATNSPLLFGKRLWHETRISLFQQSVDIRTSGENVRHRNARVMFGNDWVRGSILDLYREDIMRFRLLLSSSETENSLEILEKGDIPALYALLVHNSTVYRWNRPCYGIGGGKPHLRIENRVLPSGPTVKDEIANAALWLGLLNGVGDEYKDITKLMEFSSAKSNFVSACRNGMNNKFIWAGHKKAIPATELINKILIPIARQGLAKAKVNKKDISHYLDIIEQRAEKMRTGSIWFIESYSNLIHQEKTTVDEALTTVTASMAIQQRDNKPIHEWVLAEMSHNTSDWTPSAYVVEEFMQTDVITIHKDDIIELAARMMDWKKIKYVPVEDNKKLIGLVTARTIFRHFIENYYDSASERQPFSVASLMIKKPITVTSDTNLSEAIQLMQEHEIGCLPVINKENELLGIITEQDFLKVSGELTYRFNKAQKKKKGK